MSEQLDMLHHQAHLSHQGFDSTWAAWREYRAFAAGIASRLLFHWHAVGATNPSNNHQGGSYGSDHIVLDEPMSIGRLQRAAGDALCKPARQFHGNLWGESDGPTCKRCLEIAERIIGQE